MTSVRAALRVADIFEALAAEPEGLTLSELARRLSLPKSSAHNLVHTLRDRRYLVQGGTGLFVLGERLFEVAVCATSYGPLKTVARPVMTRLVAKVKETSFLSILTPQVEVLHVDRVMPVPRIRYDEELGQRHPPYCSSPGRVFLASLPANRLEAYLRQTRLPRLTDRTITSRRALLQELDRVRRTGVGINFDEQEMGASSVAAPIKSGTGRVIAAIVLAGPTTRIRNRLDDLVAAVREAAAEVTALLGVGEGTARPLRAARDGGGRAAAGVPEPPALVLSASTAEGDEQEAARGSVPARRRRRATRG